MHRNQWRVCYTGSRLAEAAKAKREYHATREAVWVGKKDEVMKEIRSEGMEVTETLVDEMRKLGNYTNSGSFGPTVSIRADLLNKLQEAHKKAADHERLVKEYDAWGQMMAAHAETQFWLEHDDWMFFFGK